MLCVCRSGRKGKPDDVSRASIDLLLYPDPESPSIARRAVDGLHEALDTERLQYARLLVTEMVTNAVLHGSSNPDDEIRLQIQVGSHELRVEVSDFGPGFEVPSITRDSAAKPDRYSGVESNDEQGRGHGLYLVERLSERWGVCRDGLTRVWCEIELA